MTERLFETELGDIPGGWQTQRIACGGREFDITLPADPDAFLDDPATIDEHERTDYMPYWPYLWPAAHRMAALVMNADWPSRRSVLEIGSGIGLVGLAAAARGDDVTFSDYRDESVTLSLYNARQNGFTDCRGLQLDWRHPPEERFDVLLGCEVIYERGNHEPILDLIAAMLSPGGICWIGDPGRHTADLFTADARTRSFSVQLYNEHGQPAAIHEPGEFRLIELR